MNDFLNNQLVNKPFTGLDDLFAPKPPVPFAERQPYLGHVDLFQGPPDQAQAPGLVPEDSDPLVQAQRSLSGADEMLERYRQSRMEVPDLTGDLTVPADPALEEARTKYLDEILRTPEERYREKVQRFSAEHRGIKGALKGFGEELLYYLSTAPFGAYAPPQIRMRQEAQQEFENIRPLAQQFATGSFAAARAQLSAQLRAQQLHQQAVLAQQKNDIAAANAYARAAQEQTAALRASQQAPLIAAKIGLTRAETQKIQTEIANAGVTKGLSGMSGFVMALSQLPDEQRERIMKIYKDTAEAGRDPFRITKFYVQQATQANTPKGPFTPIYDSHGNVRAFFSPRDNRIIETPFPIQAKPDTDQKAVDKANLLTVLTNLTKLRKLHDEYVKTFGTSPAGPLKGNLAIIASKYNIPGSESWKDVATAASQMNTLLRHATRTMIYLMSGKAVSEREAQDFDAIMPQLTVGAKDFDMKLAVMLATIANFAEVRFGKPVSQILEEESKMSPHMSIDLMEAAREIGRARALSRSPYYDWQKIAPRFAQKYGDILQNPSMALVASPEDLATPPKPSAVEKFRRAVSELKKYMTK
jgi:hypothetical protein